MKGDKVDYRLRERRVIIDCLTQIEKDGISVRRLERLAETLDKYGAQVGPLMLERINRCRDATLISRYMFLLECLDDERLVTPLIDLLFSSSHDIQFKARILSTLRYFDVPVNGPIMGQLFPEAFRPSSPSAAKFLSLLGANDLLLSIFLEGFYQLPPQLRVRMISELARCQGDKASFLLEIFSESNDKEVALPAIQALGAIRSVNAARILERIIRRGLRPQLVQAARRSRLRLMFLGIRKVGRSQPRPGEFYRAYVSNIDGEGNRGLWLARRLNYDRELVEQMCLVIHEELGMVECVGANASERADFVTMINRAKKEETVVEVDYPYALALVKDALYRNEAAGFSPPPEFYLRKRLFGEDDLTPQQYDPAFSEFDLAAIAGNRSLYLKSDRILHWNELKGWSFWEEEPGQFVPQPGPGSLSNRPPTNIYKQFIEKAVMTKIPLLKRRLLLTADMLSRSQGKESRIKAILATALTLDKNPQLLAAHPFIRRLVNTSLSLAGNLLPFSLEEREF